MRILFAEGVAASMAELPRSTQLLAARRLDLIEKFPQMFAVRSRGLMRGYRAFVVNRVLFYYQASSDEVRVVAILPGMMRRA